MSKSVLDPHAALKYVKQIAAQRAMLGGGLIANSISVVLRTDRVPRLKSGLCAKSPMTMPSLRNERTCSELRDMK